MEQHQLAAQLDALNMQTNNGCLTCAQQQEYEEIAVLTAKSKVQCQKLSVGQVPWCPKLSKAIAQILYWKGIQK